MGPELISGYLVIFDNMISSLDFHLFFMNPDLISGYEVSLFNLDLTFSYSGISFGSRQDFWIFIDPLWTLTLTFDSKYYVVHRSISLTSHISNMEIIRQSNNASS